MRPHWPLLVVVFLVGARGTLAQLPIAIGSEFQVNSYTPGLQVYPVVDFDAVGDFVVAWHSEFDGSSKGVFGRRFGSAGNSLGAEFQINTYTTNPQERPAIAVLPGGGFVVVWKSLNQDGSSQGVFARRFGSTGAPLGVEFQVNGYTSGAQQGVAIAAQPDGDFIVFWHGAGSTDPGGVFARRYDSAGTLQAAEFRVNTTTGGNQTYPFVGMDAGGSFVVVWTSADANLDGVFAQRFGSSGAPSGPEFQVNTHFTANQSGASVGVDSDGDFVVAWRSDLQDAGTGGIFARRFDSGGTPTGLELQVNTYVPGEQFAPRVASDGDGDFVIVWTSYQDGSQQSLVARRFENPSLVSTPELQVNTYVTGAQFFSEVAVDGDGDFIVVWTGLGQDGSSYGVFAQRFDVPTRIDVDGDGQYLPLTDGVLLLRFGFGFTGNTLITGAVGLGCTRCDAPSITAYLQSLL